jgi:hypothetical protein
MRKVGSTQNVEMVPMRDDEKTLGSVRNETAFLMSSCLSDMTV